MSSQLTTECFVLLQALAAMVLGGVVGWEREAAGQWAGFRTHMLVCLACMLFVRLGQILIADSMEGFPTEAFRADPAHLLTAIATGVAFLGAGTIFRDASGDNMRGLTTAASLLVVASVGIAVAIDHYVIAAGITLLAILILHSLRILENRCIKKSDPAQLPGGGE